ncbi:130_t:CDS:1, partial [Rhizophagus irregularis]
NPKGKRKESNNIEPSGAASSRKKFPNKQYKKERNDWNPKWPYTYPYISMVSKKRG